MPTRAAVLAALVAVLTACGSDLPDVTGAATEVTAPSTPASASSPSAGAGAGAAAPAMSAGTRAPSGCIDDISAGHHVYTCNDLKMDVEIPAACTTAAACGLIVDAHGQTMTAGSEDANTNMRALGAQNNFVVVQPNARGAPSIESWNATTDDPILYGFIVLALDALGIDRKRVHFMGFSDGGEGSFRFLCKHADIFASVAPAAGEGCTFKDGDVPSREIPILYMHGTKDLQVDFQKNAVPQRDAIVAGWSMGTGAAVANGDGFVRTRWTSPKGTVFELLQHDYEADDVAIFLGGHCVPGSKDTGNGPDEEVSIACAPPNGFVWGEEVMRFFLAHPSP